jgi:ribosomal protein S18 acetylase RimI-like enzyme
MQTISHTIPFFEPINFKKNYHLFLHLRKSTNIDIAGSFDLSEGKIKRYIDKNIESFGEEAFLHMFLNNKIIGQMEIGTKNNNGYVYFFYIVPSFRAKGYFKFLHEKMLSIMKKRKFEYVILSTAFWHKSAINIYKKYGWKFAGENKEKENMFFLKLIIT